MVKTDRWLLLLQIGASAHFIEKQSGPSCLLLNA